MGISISIDVKEKEHKLKHKCDFKALYLGNGIFKNVYL